MRRSFVCKHEVKARDEVLIPLIVCLERHEKHERERERERENAFIMPCGFAGAREKKTFFNPFRSES